MEQQQADVVITVEWLSDLTREKIGPAGFALCGAASKFAMERLTLAQFVGHQHALVSYRGASESAP
ncbi:hypothetical protein LZ023_40515 (plasmid) [Pseudomonas silvicola]|nr:hypothetical protein LZ023_40515 [Pseudomonas silvicola]